MSLIIAATDFSPVSHNAVIYACQLAVVQNAQLIIIHSFTFPIMFSDVPLPAALINDTENDLQIQMKNLVRSLNNNYPQLDIQGIVIDGDLVNALESYAQNNREPWLVILGNSNTGDHNTWESHMLAAFKHLKYPTLAVPPGTVYTPVKKICLAFDNKHEGNDVAFTQLRDLVLALNAELLVLNAQEDVHNRDNSPVIDEQAQQILARANPHFHIIYEVNIDDAIEDFISKNAIDWIVMIPRKHSFFEGLFHKSHSKAIAHSTHIPLVALHETHTS